MKDIPINLESLKKEDLFAVATALLYTLKDSPKYSTMSELFYILDYENFIRLIKYFGGKEIRVPSSEEIGDMMKTLLLYQYREVEGYSWEEALIKSEVPESESKSARYKVNELSRIIKSQEIGGRRYD